MRERLLFTLAAALTPILVFAGVQAYVDSRNGLEERRRDLLVITERTVDRVDYAMASAESLLSVFAEEIAQNRCRDVHERIRGPLPYISNIAHINTDGIAVCATISEPGFPITKREWLDELRDEGDPSRLRTEAFYGRLAQTWLFAVVERLETAEGEFAGLATFTISIADLLRASRTDVLPADVEVAIADTTGTVFGSDRFTMLSGEAIRDVTASGHSALLVAQSEGGTRYDVVISPVGAEGAFAVLSRKAPGAFSPTNLRPVAAVGVPVLVFLLALLTAWVAVDIFVLKWLKPLRRLAVAYAQGQYDYRLPATFDRPPQEIARLLDTFHGMARRIGQRDDDLRAAITVRDAAVKEIHHRIKNNLQIVTSFVSLQARAVADPEARRVLAQVRHRIDALSIVHQTLYQYERLDSVNMQAFFDALLNHLGEALGADDLDIELRWEIDEVDLHTDDAIPMGLFVLEAVTNALKYAFADEGGKVMVTLVMDDEEIALTVADDGRGHETGAQANGTGLGTKLMNAFAKQIRGTLRIEEGRKRGYAVTLSLPAERAENLS